MATEDLLDEAEFDALKKAAASQKAGAPESALVSPDEPVTPYDLDGLEAPAAEGAIDPRIVYERFERELKSTMLRTYRTTVGVELGEIETVTFGALRESLEVPASINHLCVAPLRGSGIAAVDWRLAFTMVDLYFGGPGVPPESPTIPALSPAEQRVAQTMVDLALVDLMKAWEPHCHLGIERLGCESNARFVSFPGLADGDKLLLCTVGITFPEGGGTLFLALPQAVIEHVGARGVGAIQGSGEADEVFQRGLYRNLQGVDLDLECRLLETTVSVQRLLNLRPGDVLPVIVPDTVVLTAESVPLLEGTCGESDGQCAIQVQSWVQPS